jgi:hypothetical protein
MEVGGGTWKGNSRDEELTHIRKKEEENTDGRKLSTGL